MREGRRVSSQILPELLGPRRGGGQQPRDVPAERTRVSRDVLSPERGEALGANGVHFIFSQRSFSAKLVFINQFNFSHRKISLLLTNIKRSVLDVHGEKDEEKNRPLWGKFTHIQVEAISGRRRLLMLFA